MKKKLLTIVLASMLSVVAFCTAGVGAATPPSVEGKFDSDVNYKKALLEGVYRCYQYGFFKNQIDYRQDYVDFDSITNNSGDVKNEDFIALPNSMNRLEDSNVSCAELFSGYNVGGNKNTFSGIFNWVGISVPTAKNSGKQLIKSFLNNLGYGNEQQSGSNNDDQNVEKTVSLKYDSYYMMYAGLYNQKVNNGSWYLSVGAIVNKSTNKVLKITKETVPFNYFRFSIMNDGTRLLVERVVVVAGASTVEATVGEIILDSDHIKYGYYNNNYNYVEEELDNTFENFAVAFVNVVGSGGKDLSYGSSSGYGSSATYHYILDDSYGFKIEEGSYDNNDILGFSSWEEASSSAISYLSEGRYKNWADLKYDSDEKIGLYNDYLTKYYGMKILPEEGELKLSSGDELAAAVNEIGYMPFYVPVHTETNVEDILDLTEEEKEQINGYNSYVVYLISDTPAKNKGVSVYKINDDGHFCADGAGYTCGISYADLINEHNRLVERMISERTSVWGDACKRATKDLVAQRRQDLALLQNIRSFANDFISETYLLLDGYDAGVLVLPDKYYDGYTAYNTTQVITFYKNDFTTLYNDIMRGYNGQAIFRTADADGELIITKLYNALIAMLNETNIDGGIVARPSDEVLGYIRELLNEFQIDVGEFDEGVQEIKTKFDYVDERIRMEQYIWKESDKVSGVVICLAVDEENYPLNYILREVDEKMQEVIGGGTLRELSLNWENPFSDFDAAAQGTDQGANDAQVCYVESGSLGWVLCPVIDALSWFGGVVWKDVEQNFLKIPSAEIFDSSSGVRKAWGIIRDFANIVFVLLFLVVIFSQLTGIGIDNYGVKKILPKIILIAVLVNLSWIICELAVDLSNILGVGANSILSDSAGGIAPAVYIGQKEYVFSTWVSDILLGAGGIIMLIWLAPMLAISAALAALGAIGSVVIAILVLYFILIIREIGIIIVIVLAPVAIVCYALPNTEKLAKKWLGLFKALLVVYPLCGLVVGGGKLASAVLANIGVKNNSTAMTLAAMLMQVIPFFLIPMLLKNSLALLGNIGARLSQVGKGLSRKGSGALKSGVKNSDRFKNWSQYQNNKAAVRRAKRVQSRYTDANGNKLKGLTRREEDRLAQAQDVINADNQRRARAHVGVFAIDDGLAEKRAQSTRDVQELKASQDEFAGYDQPQLRDVANNASSWLGGPGGQQRMSALISAMEANGMQKDIYKMLRDNPIVGNKTNVMQALANSRDKVLRAYGKKGAGMSYEDFMTKTIYKDIDGNYTTDATKAAPDTTAVASSMMAQYAKEKGGDFLEGLDDKALSQIMTYSTDSYANNKIMDSGLLVQAAATIKSQDAIDEINSMLRSRSDISITGEQLANINFSTYSTILKTDNGYSAIQRAYNDIINKNPQLLTNMDVKVADDLKNNIAGLDIPHDDNRNA